MNMLAQACVVGTEIDEVKPLLAAVGTVDSMLPSPANNDETRAPALHWACAAMRPNLALVQWLVRDCGADTTKAASDGSLPLHFACEKGNLEIARWLVAEGFADPLATADRGRTALHVACENGHLEVARWLVAECSVDSGVTTEQRQTALHLACFYGHLEVARWLVTDGLADPDATEDNGVTALHYAYMEGRFEVGRWLVAEGGADPLVAGWSNIDTFLERKERVLSQQERRSKRVFSVFSLLSAETKRAKPAEAPRRSKALQLRAEREKADAAMQSLPEAEDKGWLTTLAPTKKKPKKKNKKQRRTKKKNKKQRRRDARRRWERAEAEAAETTRKAAAEAKLRAAALAAREKSEAEEAEAEVAAPEAARVTTKAIVRATVKNDKQRAPSRAGAKNERRRRRRRQEKQLSKGLRVVEEDDRECAICLEALKNVEDALVTKCCHVFCRVCILRSMLQATVAKSCPCCREPISFDEMMEIRKARA